MAIAATTIELFISYSVEDTKYLEQLVGRLGKRQPGGLVYHVLYQTVESDPHHVLRSFLNSAAVVLVLVSPNYLKSNFAQKEMAEALDGRTGAKRIIPIILEPCDWLSTRLSKYQALPPGAPVSTWREEGEAFAEIMRELASLFIVRRTPTAGPDQDDARELPPTKKAARAKQRQSSSTSATPSAAAPSPQGRRITDYRFSSEAAKIIAAAEHVQPSEPTLTSAAILYSALVHANASGKTSNFFVDVVHTIARAARTFAFAEPVFRGRVERLGVRITHFSRNATTVMDSALRAALGTTGGRVIALRHLVFALIQPSPVAGKDSVLTSLGVDVASLTDKYLAYLRKHLPLPDELPKWGRLVRRTAPAREMTAYAPVYASDQTAVVDLLGFEKDARALASLIASRETRPPLAIGLFGDWGSGKSFFMRQIRELVAQTADRAAAATKVKRSTAYYGNVVQIEFNAWHYIEGNLWASLVEHIFSNLRLRPDADRDDRELEKKRSELLKMLHVEEQQQDAARAAKDAALKAADDARAARGKKIEERVRLQLAKTNDWTSAFSEDDLATLGISKQTVSTIGRLRDHGTLWWVAFGRIIAAAKLFKGEKGATLRFSFLLLFLTALLPAGAYAIATLTGAINVVKAVVAAIPVAWAFVSWITPYVTGAGRIAASVQEKHRELDLRRQQQAIAIDQEIAALSRGVEQAEARALQAEQRIEAIKTEMEQLSSAMIFSSFLEERAASSDYRRHLGVLANIRRDFERMARLLEKQQNDPEHPALIERIVLYVDDLDRCPAKRVVEVLQAIHLLLAFPIFIVVVGVDARWIARALQTEYDTLLGHADDGLDESFGAEATAHDYLQKIFQVPFWIRSMNDASCIDFIAGLTASATMRETPTFTTRTEPASALVPEISAPSEEPSSEQSMAPVAHAPAIETPAATSDDDLNPIALHILPDEIELMNRLTLLLGRSPRAVKRFINCYQLIKIGLDPADIGPFLTDPTAALYFKPVMFLLAVVTGTPEFGERLLDALERPEVESMTEVNALVLSWPAVFGTAFAAERGDVAAVLMNESESDPEAWRPAALRAAEGVVRRYSFRAGYSASHRERKSVKKEEPRDVNVIAEARPPEANA